VHGRAEHVEEEHDEDDRLDRHVEQALGDARDRPQAATGEEQRLAHLPGDAGTRG